MTADPAVMNGRISVVVPVYNESEVISAFYARVKAAVSALSDLDYELLFVDDGSIDDSYAQLAELAESDPRVRVIKFSPNFGHQIAEK